ncbi:MAG: UDP-N-acetylmuramate dehydrogenase [Bdellovibrionota bacterium]
MKLEENVKLAPFTYYKIGGHARYFVQPESVQQLEEISRFLNSTKNPYFILGAGSNVLFDDDGFEGLIIQTSKLNRTLEHPSPSCIKAGSATQVIQLLRLCMNEGISGFEFLVGIPGNVGGALYMNAGTKLGEVKDVLQEITTFDLLSGEERKYDRQQIRYEYRSQHFLSAHEIITGGTFTCAQSTPERVQAEIQALLALRKKSQPIDKPSCGSVFKNPDPAKGLHAWKLIADTGLRGHRIGAAQISELHTNFIINLGGAKAKDVLGLISLAKNKVKDAFGISLEEEVRIIPRTGANTLQGDKHS